MISVKINGVSVPYKDGLQITELFNETLDTGLVIIPQVSEMTIEPMDQVLIEDTGFTKYMLVSHVKGSVIHFETPRTYNYTLELISPTIQLQRITMPNRSITQPLTGTKKTIWDVIKNYRDIYYPGATLTTALYTKTRYTNCPELQWNQPTLFEVMNDLLSVVDSVVTMTNFNTISYLDLKKQGSAINTAYINNFETNRGIEEYANRLEIEAKNAVYKKRNTQTYEIVTPRTTQGAILTGENAELILHKPAYTIDEIICIYYDTYTDIGYTEIDITDYVVEKKVYDTYKASISTAVVSGMDYKRNAIYFTEGSNIISGLTYREETWFPTITSKSAIINIICNIVGQTYLQTNLGVDSIPELGFKIKYTTIEDVKFISEKEVLNTHDSVLINNQSTSYVDISALANNQQQTVNRIGNPENQLYGRYTTYTDIPNLADTFDTNYILVSRQIIFRSNYYEFTGQVLKYYVMKNLYTGLNSKKRYLQLASSNDSFISNHLTVIKSNFTQTNDTEDYVLENYLLKFATADMFPKLSYFEINLKNTVNTIKLGLAGSGHALPNSIVYNVAFPDNFNAGIRIEKENALLDLGAYSVVYVPYVDSNGEFESIEMVLYNDFSNPNFAVDSSASNRKIPLNRARDYPLIDASLLDMTDIVFETGQLLRYKDNREITSETMQFLFNSDSDIFIGDQYYIDNPFVFTDTTKTLYVYTSPTETYSKGDQDAKGTVLNTGVDILLNRITSSASYATWTAQTIASWCIADSSGKIYLAVNGNNRYIYLVSDTTFIRAVAEVAFTQSHSIAYGHFRSTEAFGSIELSNDHSILYGYKRSTNISNQLAFTQLHSIAYDHFRSTEAFGSIELSNGHSISIDYIKSTDYVSEISFSQLHSIAYTHFRSTEAFGSIAFTQLHSIAYDYIKSTDAVGSIEFSQLHSIAYGYIRSPELYNTVAFTTASSIILERMNVVRFLDWNDTVLKVQEVPDGNDATPPANPTRTGYTFTGWSPGYTNVIDDVVTYAQYIYAPIMPYISYDSKTTTSLSFYITNNSPYTCTIYYEQSDTTPDANSVELGAGVSSSLLTISGLASNTQYSVYAQAWAGNYKSSVNSFTETTEMVQVVSPTLQLVCSDDGVDKTLSYRAYNNDATAVTMYIEVGDSTPDISRGTIQPSAWSSLYDLVITTSVTVYAQATAVGLADSDIVSQYYNIALCPLA